MLKVLICIACDSCKQQFLYSRASSGEPYSWYLDTHALTAMASDYHWDASHKGKYHYCPDCSFQMEDMARLAQ